MDKKNIQKIGNELQLHKVSAGYMRDDPADDYWDELEKENPDLAARYLQMETKISPKKSGKKALNPSKYLDRL